MNEDRGGTESPTRGAREAPRPTPAQAAYLRRGLAEPGGKLPLFDRDGQRYASRTIRSCIDQGWAEPWFHNPIKPDWLICRLTEAGRKVLAETDPPPPARPTRRRRTAGGFDARRLQRLVRDWVEA
jgi:hypothetical protein